MSQRFCIQIREQAQAGEWEFVSRGCVMTSPSRRWAETFEDLRKANHHASFLRGLNPQRVFKIIPA